MPKETFGGDDEGGGGGEEIKKLDLSKFGLAPDTNIRDVFWKIMASYAATKKPGVDLATLQQDRFALMRVALSVLSSPHIQHYGLPPKFISEYSIMMMVDGAWEDALFKFLEKSSEKRSLMEEVKQPLDKLLTKEGYKERLFDCFTKMLRKRDTVATGLSYVAEVKNADLARAMKKELVILARGDIGENQKIAIRLISLIKEDEDVKKSLIILLSHWDVGARLAAAEALEGIKDDAVKKAAELRMKNESDGKVKKILERIVK
ncbi:hypothetical protein KKB44_00550 [Candidatus Micrarchaeota archaeon]|nr:hypothetical protein [Candidatus Micrarchaeota archaeon]